MRYIEPEKKIDERDSLISELLCPQSSAPGSRPFVSASDAISFIQKGDCDLRSRIDHAVFYSGLLGPTLEVTLGKCLTRLGMNGIFDTLDLTVGGIELSSRLALTALSSAHRSPIWDIASERFAQLASGAVTCFIGMHDLDSRLARIEIPALCQNSLVTSINSTPIERIRAILAEDGIQSLLGQLHEALHPHLMESLVGKNIGPYLIGFLLKDIDFREKSGWSTPLILPIPRLE